MEDFAQPDSGIEGKRFFLRADWIAAVVTFLVALAVYTVTLAPTVTLEDSGELIVASDYLGVPHPPGYPSWTVLTWLFQLIFHFKTYHGYPNPAWAVNFFSAFSGAMACGVIALLVSCSGRRMLNALPRITQVLGSKTESLFCAVAGICSGLLLAFSQGMWSQSVIAEVYSLNVLFQSLVLVLLYRWWCEPENHTPLYAMAFIYGLGLTNHQTLVFMGLALGVAVFFREVDWRHKDFVFSLLGGVCAVGALAASKYNAMPLMLISVTGAFVFAGLIRQMRFFRDFFICGMLLVLVFLFNRVAATNIALYGEMGARPEMAALRSVYMEKSAYWNGLQWVLGPAHNAFWLWSLAAALLPLSLAFNFGRRKLKSLLAFGAVALAFAVLQIVAAKTGRPSLSAWTYSFVPFGTRSSIELSGFESPLFLGWLGLAALTVTGVNLNLKHGRTVSFTFLLILLGLSFYLYMPISGDQNPPINWGYPRTWEGFMHAVTRGQYEKVVLADIFSDKFLMQILFFLRDIRNQFLLPFALLALVPFAAMFRLKQRNNMWLITSVVAFLGVGFVFIILQNPKLDLQTQFIARVQYIQSHAIYAIWIGYGLLLMMALLESLVRNNPFTKVLGVALVLAAPSLLIHKNYTSPDQLRTVGGSEQNGHDFGWQFGNWQLQGVDGIKADLQYKHSPEEFEKIWAAYPDKTYPAPMETNAIFFGGTDPGRFVPTYMIYCPQVRPDVYLITQNALADYTYIQTMRDMYGDQIWLPLREDNDRAFQDYFEKVRRGEAGGADVQMRNGRMSVQGVAGVMQINAIICKMIFDNNQYIAEAKTDEETRMSAQAVVPYSPDPENPVRRAFYVEESYVLDWMYPYLTPHGLIMKINNEKTPLTPEAVKKDHDFWTWYCDYLLNDPRFVRDISAQKTFSKLRGAIAGLYAARGLRKEAEFAFRQSLALCPLSPEATMRLSILLQQEGRYDEALETVNALLAEDELNESAQQYRDQLLRFTGSRSRLEDLEAQMKDGKKVNPLELVQLNLNLNRRAKALGLIDSMLQKPNDDRELYRGLLSVLIQLKDVRRMEKALAQLAVLEPDNLDLSLDLAGIRLALQDRTGCFAVLRDAVEKHGDTARRQIAEDKRFGTVRNTPEYRALGIRSAGPAAAFPGAFRSNP